MKKIQPRIDWPADKIERRRVMELVPHAQNARTHSAAQIDQIAASITEWGWTVPVLVDEGGGIIAGHGRVLAARKLGLVDVPVMVARGWSDAQKRAYLLADNKLALNSTWNEDVLKSELTALGDVFDVSLTGFDDPELKQLFEEPEGIKVFEIEANPVNDRFWISIRGLLKDQAEVLTRLTQVMREFDIDVELGSTPID